MARTLLDAALTYAQRGWSVLPLHTPLGANACSCSRPSCASVGKHPRTPNGVKDASADPATVRKWWTTWPDANIGVATGAASGLVVVDIDPRNGGDVGFAEFEADHGELPLTATVATGGGGKHLFYRRPEGAVKWKSKLVAGVDVKADGGYVVAAPSVHASGAPYTWVDEMIPLAPAPGYLLTGKARTARGNPAAPLVPANSGPERNLEEVKDNLRALENVELRELWGRVLRGDAFAQPGERDNTLQRLASAVAFLAPDNDAAALAQLFARSLSTMASSDADPPPTLDDVVDKIERAQADAVARREAEGVQNDGIRRAIEAAGAARKGAVQGDGVAGRDNSKVNEVVDLVRNGFVLFHTPEGVGYAADGVRAWPIDSSGFRDRVLHCLFRHGVVIGETTLKMAEGILNSIAKFEGPERAVHLRTAEANGAIYIDLADTSGTVVEVRSNGWKVIGAGACPVVFRRPPGMQPLPVPVAGGNLTELRALLNLGTGPDADRTWALIAGWLVAALRPRGPYPVLALHGEHGAAKSTASRMLRGLVDPNAAPLRKMPGETRDLAVAADNSWVIVFDNISSVSPDLSDALCRLATGGAFATRALYANRDEELFIAQRPIVLNGIGDVIARSDLLDRTILVNLPTIPEAKRRTETAVWADYEAAAPRLFGALLDAMAVALGKLATVALASLPRMADFAMWATAAEARLGLPAGGFIAAYDENRQAADVVALEASPLYPVLESLTATPGPQVFTNAKQLLERLNRHIQGDASNRDWPRSPRALTNALRRLAPNLRKANIDVQFPPRTPGTGQQPIVLQNTALATAPAPPISSGPVRVPQAA